MDGGVLEDGQKAPSAKRCIKTGINSTEGLFGSHGQKAPSAKRCIKTQDRVTSPRLGVLSERTERQMVH